MYWEGKSYYMYVVFMIYVNLYGITMLELVLGWEVVGYVCSIYVNLYVGLACSNL